MRHTTQIPIWCIKQSNRINIHILNQMILLFHGQFNAFFIVMAITGYHAGHAYV